MWICKNCQNRNEENFRYCWGCGRSRPAGRRPLSDPTTEVSFSREESGPAAEEIPQVQKITPAAKTDPAAGQTAEKKTGRPVEKTGTPRDKSKKEPTKKKTAARATAKRQKQPAAEEPLVFSFYETGSADRTKESSSGRPEADRINWEKRIFTIALRLAGLYLLVRVIIDLPDLVGQIATTLAASPSFGDLLFLTAFPLAKYLFYLAAGLYLIGSGRMLVRLLPDR